MPDATLILLILVIVAALVFDYINGFHDPANAIATCVSTRALSVKGAILMAAVLNFAGAMVSTKVAATIGKGIVNPQDVTQMVVLAGVLGAIIWNVITWYFGLPSSSSHAIIGGLIGGVIAHAGHKEKDLLEMGRQAGSDHVATNGELTFKIELLLTAAQ